MKRSSLVGKFLLLLTLFSALLYGAPTFPELSGRVVDEANLLSQAQIISLQSELERDEQATTNQIVVVTLNSLQGYEIEEYGYQLGRHWGIGQKGKDNGLLLIVAPNERKVRIEVGYGLEGIITDKIAYDIIQEVILPAFKRGDFAEGIIQGVDAIIKVLYGDSFDGMSRASDGEKEADSSFGIAMFLFFVIYPFLSAFVAKLSERARLYWSLAVGLVVGITVFVITALFVMALFIGIMAFLHAYLINSKGGSSSWNSSGGYSGSSGGFSSFSGGGGSFGGGGASGSW